jgi:hypothetical protein
VKYDLVTKPLEFIWTIANFAGEVTSVAFGEAVTTNVAVVGLVTMKLPFKVPPPLVTVAVVRLVKPVPVRVT